MIAAIYARKSSDEPGRDAEDASCPTQIDRAREFAKAKGCIKPDPFAAWMQCEDGYFRLHREGVTNRERRPDRIRLLD